MHPEVAMRRMPPLPHVVCPEQNVLHVRRQGPAGPAYSLAICVEYFRGVHKDFRLCGVVHRLEQDVPLVVGDRVRPVRRCGSAEVSKCASRRTLLDPVDVHAIDAERAVEDVVHRDVLIAPFTAV